MTEQAALLTAIAAEPGDDVRRLGYADWLQENDQHDRAEFIRVQIRLATPPWNSRDLIRSEQLLDRHLAEWSRLPCPACGGCGEMVFADMPRVRSIIEIVEGNVPNTAPPPPVRRGPCPTCGGSGDLFTDRRFNDFGSSHVDDVRTVTFSRGFPESVSCTLGEVVRPDGKATEWARAVVRAAPVVRFVPTDAEAQRVGYYGFGWIKRTRQAGLHHVPEEVFRRLTGALLTDHGRDFTQFRFYESPEAAKDALSLASGDFVRAEVHTKAVPT